MLDIHFIRDNADLVQENADHKNCPVSIKDLLNLDSKRQTLLQKIESKRSERNSLIKQSKNGRPTKELIEQGKALKDLISDLEDQFKVVDKDYTDLIKQVPNMATPDVPVGKSEDDNVVAKVVGEVTKFDFKPLTHYEIALKHDWIDKERAAKVSGSRFAYIKGNLVKLEFAIICYVISTLTDSQKLQKIIDEAGLNVPNKPFIPILPPLMIRTEMYDAMDRLEPRDERYKIEGEDLWLEGSAEHVMGSMHADEIFEESELPRRYLGFASSFRKEAGAYGKDVEGIFRMHQFDKLEMEGFSTKENSFNEHLLFIAIEEHMLSDLKLPYRVISKCTADIGKPDARGIDMEVWLPGQNNYRETHSADYMTDYQTRRLKTRVRLSDGQIELAHTNDATAFALGRTMIAIMENYQTKDGDVIIPEVLKPYLNNQEIL